MQLKKHFIHISLFMNCLTSTCYHEFTHRFASNFVRAILYFHSISWTIAACNGIIYFNLHTQWIYAHPNENDIYTSLLPSLSGCLCNFALCFCFRFFVVVSLCHWLWISVIVCIYRINIVVSICILLGVRLMRTSTMIRQRRNESERKALIKNTFCRRIRGKEFFSNFISWMCAFSGSHSICVDDRRRTPHFAQCCHHSVSITYARLFF